MGDVIRLYTPRKGERLPNALNLRHVPDIGDTGGGWYRPTHRQQNPAVDPAEPKNESSDAGYDHGWSNCTMSSGAMALDFATLGESRKWGGDMRHHQGDLSGGTDLYDLQDAFDAYGETLTIRSGAGWDALKSDRAAGKFIVIQGSGNVPGSESFDGGHACALGPETSSDGKWLFGDPLADGWQWCSESSIRDWAKHWNSGISYATTVAHKPASEPEPPKPEEPETGGNPPYWPSFAVGHAIEEAQSRLADSVFATWLIPIPQDFALWDEAGEWDDAEHTKWVAFPVPLRAVARSQMPARWDSESGWTAALWDNEPIVPPTVSDSYWETAQWAAEWADAATNRG